jgi:hypothetical protein
MAAALKLRDYTFVNCACAPGDVVLLSAILLLPLRFTKDYQLGVRNMPSFLHGPGKTFLGDNILDPHLINLIVAGVSIRISLLLWLQGCR